MRATNLVLAAVSLATLAAAPGCGGKGPAEAGEVKPLPPDDANLRDEVDEPPPSPQMDDLVFERRPGHVWLEGHWVLTPNGWRWEPGRYLEGRDGFIYIQGRWERRGARWVWVEGRWVPGRVGYVWRRGYWELRGDTWAWVPGEWVSRREGYVWHSGQWERRGARWVWVPGRWRPAGS